MNAGNAEYAISIKPASLIPEYNHSFHLFYGDMDSTVQTDKKTSIQHFAVLVYLLSGVLLHDDYSVCTSVTKSSYWHSMTNMPSITRHAQSDVCESQRIHCI